MPSPSPRRRHPRAASTVAVRRAVLAACVLDDLDLEPHDDAVVLTAPPAVTVPWSEVAGAFRFALGQGEEAARAAVSRWLRTRRVAADLGTRELARRARPVGLPVGHPLHPGPSWVRERVLGDALELGLGFLGVGADPDRVELLDDRALLAAGAQPTAWWPAARDYLEQMGAIALERLRRLDPARPGVHGVLRPIGDADVVTLLGSRTLRRGLAEADGTGMRALAVPMRRRGWLDLRAIDPAFAPAAAAATGPDERGFASPVLVTGDEVALAPSGGAAATIVLRDPAPAEPALPDVLYR